MARQSAEIVIVGGGVIGCATAFFLRELGFTGRVVVVEKDASYRFASTARSAASIRQQFTTPVSTRMSQFSWGFFESLKERFGEEGEIALVRSAYLLLADAARVDNLRDSRPSVSSAPTSPGWSAMSSRSAFPG